MNKNIRFMPLSLFTIAVVLSACAKFSSAPVDQSCDPGQVRSCLCDGGRTEGVQTCAASGESWSECGCEREIGTSVAAEMVHSDTLLVLDRSASMLGYGYLAEISDILEELVEEMEDFTDFGLMLFPGSDCTPGGGPNEACAVPAEPYVPIDPDNGSDQEVVNVLNSWENGFGVCGATPIAASLDVARAYLNEVDYGVPQMIVLITDGAPNCNFELDGSTCECTDQNQIKCMSDPHLCLDDVATAAAAAALHADGIPVYVISLGDEITPFDDVMDAIADAGGTTQALTAKALADVSAQFAEVQPELHTCQIAVDWSQVGNLTGESNISDMAPKTTLWGKASIGTPLTQAQAISYDPGCTGGNGFDLIADNKISLCSAVCNDLKGSKISAIDVTVTKP